LYTSQEFFQLEALMKGQGEVLQMITQGEPLSIVLEKLTGWVEAQSGEELIAAVFRIDDDQRLYKVAGNHLPEGYTEAMNGLPIENVQSTGHAFEGGKKAAFDNLNENNFFDTYEDIAIANNIFPCRATTLINNNNTLRGFFATYYTTEKAPVLEDVQLTSLAAHTALLAIEYNVSEENCRKSSEREQQVYATLQKSEQRFQNLVREATIGIIVLLGENMVVDLVNEMYGKLIDRKPDDLLGKPLFDIIPEVEKDFRPIIDKVRLTGESVYLFDHPYSFITSGEKKQGYLNLVYQPYKGESNTISGVMVLCHDVTEKVLSQKKLQESEKSFRNLVMQAPLAVAVFTGEDFIAEIVNDSYLPLVGKTREEFVGKPLFESLPEAREVLEPLAKTVVQTGEAFPASEFEIVLNRNGKAETCYFNFIWKPYEVNDKINGFIVVANEITEQVKARKKIEESEQQVRSFVESAPYPIGIYTGKEMRIQFANQAILNAWGKGNDVIGKRYADVLPELTNQEVFKQLDDVFTTGKPFHAANQQLDLEVDGKKQPYYFTYSFTPLLNTEGNIYGVMNTGADVTEINVAHNKVEESERNLRNIILQAPVAMCIFRGPEYIVEIANAQMFEFWGKPGSEVLHKPIFEGLPEAKNQGFEDLLHKVYTTGTTVTAYGQSIILPRQGRLETVYVNYVYEAFKEGDGTIAGVMAVATDVTEQALAIKKIEEAEERARLAVEAGELGTYEVNLLTQEIVSSPRMEAIYDTKNLSNRNSFISTIHPDDLKIREAAYETAYKTGILEYEGRIIWKDNSIHWVRAKGRIYFNKENGPVRLLGVVQDITDQKLFAEALSQKVEERTRELALANEHLASSNQELEQFTYAASHDMQEPLRKVQTFSSILLQQADQLDDRIKNYLTKINTSVQRMKTIIDDLLNYSHQLKEAKEFIPTDLNKIIEDIEADLEIIIQQKNATIIKESLPSLSVVPGQIHQLFFNLFNNALKFTKPDVPVRINIAHQLANAEEVATKALDEQQRFIKITFSDNGIGFEQKYAEYIFSLFKRLHGKNEYEGTGIGLGLCKKIVENHGGAIWATSEPGEGATFHILLPM
jgi:PAS domain S-box-containing protein